MSSVFFENVQRLIAAVEGGAERLLAMEPRLTSGYAVTRPVTLSISAVDLALLSPDGGTRWNIEVSVARVAASFFLRVSWHLWVAPQPTPSSKHRFLKP